MSTVKTSQSPRFGPKHLGILRIGFFADITFRREFYLRDNFMMEQEMKTLWLPKIPDVL
jgi:hypothetical protein